MTMYDVPSFTTASNGTAFIDQYIVISHFVSALCLVLSNVGDDMCEMRDSWITYIKLSITFTVSTSNQWYLYIFLQ